MKVKNKQTLIVGCVAVVCTVIIAGAKIHIDRVNTNNEIKVETTTTVQTTAEQTTKITTTKASSTTKTTTTKVVEKTTKKPSPKKAVTSTTKKVDNKSKSNSLGTFKLTAYCNCSKCCGKWAGGATASGKMPKAGRTIAVDTRVIPFGTKVKINGKTYMAEDTGSAIKGNRIDIYMDSHQAALNFGVQYAEVFKVS